jgi:hypothetical protein
MPREKNPRTPAERRRVPRKDFPARKSAVGYPNFVDPQQRAELIAKAAYYRAMHRGFAPGHEAADWLAAEAEVDAELLRGSAKAPSV